MPFKVSVRKLARQADINRAYSALQETLRLCTILPLLPVTLHTPCKGDSKKMRRLVSALTLVCVLGNTALAGEVHTTGITATQNPNPIATVILTILSAIVS